MLKKKASKRPVPGTTNIGISNPVHASLKLFAADRGMVLRIAAERAISAGIEKLGDASTMQAKDS